MKWEVLILMTETVMEVKGRGARCQNPTLKGQHNQWNIIFSGQ